MKIGFIGMGNMGQALVKGFVSSGKIKGEDVFAYAPNQENLAKNCNMLGIKPLLKFSNGEIFKHDTVRTYKKAYRTLLETFKEKGLSPADYEFYVLNFDADVASDEVVALTKEYFPEFDVSKTIISINVCAHCGPGTVGLGYCKKV